GVVHPCRCHSPDARDPLVRPIKASTSRQEITNGLGYYSSYHSRSAADRCIADLGLFPRLRLLPVRHPRGDPDRGSHSGADGSHLAPVQIKGRSLSPGPPNGSCAPRVEGRPPFARTLSPRTPL